VKLHPSEIGHGEPWRLRDFLLVIANIAVFLFIVDILRSIDGGPSQDAKQKAAMADISMVKEQLQMFKLDNGRYPTTTEDIQALVTNPGNLPRWNHPYLDKLPIDPWQHPYIYRQPGPKGHLFEVFSTGPDGIAGNADDIHYLAAYESAK